MKTKTNNITTLANVTRIDDNTITSNHNNTGGNISYTNITDDNKIIALWLSQKSKATQKNYTYSYRKFFNFVNITISEIKLEHLLNYRDYLINNFNYKTNTINNKIAAIKSLITFSFNIGYIKLNVSTLVKTVKYRDTLIEKILDRDEVEKLLTQSLQEKRDGKKYHLLIKLLVSSGLRINELINLKSTDIKNNTLTIFGKGGKTRYVHINDALLNELLMLKKPYSEYIFHNSKGGKLLKSAIHRKLKTIANHANINESVSCHWFRHTFATMAIDNGCDLYVLQKTLGHSSLETTGKYLHVKPNNDATKFVHF